jgi:hypothetical protein
VEVSDGGRRGAAEILPFGPTADGLIYDLERLRDAQARPAAAPVRTGEHDFRCGCYRRRGLWVAMDLEMRVELPLRAENGGVSSR